MTYDSETYGKATAHLYDTLYSDFLPPREQITLLGVLANGGHVVEMGSGTGRIAIPLAATGTPVTAVDASPQMTAALAGKLKTMQLPVTPVTANAADYRSVTPVSLVFACFNTFFLLADEDKQRAFLRNTVASLAPDGRLLIETFVPRPGGRLPDGPHPGVLPVDQTVALKRQTIDSVTLFSATNNREQRRFDYREIVLRDGEAVRVVPGLMRYWWPEEIDQLAAEAGLTLAHRWSDWAQTPYDRASSPRHISVYRLAVDDRPVLVA